MLYNYPPGKAEIGASYLDVFYSAYELLVQLYIQGYDIVAFGEIDDVFQYFGNVFFIEHDFKMLDLQRYN